MPRPSRTTFSRRLRGTETNHLKDTESLQWIAATRKLGVSRKSDRQQTAVATSWLLNREAVTAPGKVGEEMAVQDILALLATCEALR